jgi:5-formyltetrahydrofolate cyclo-ligase
LLSRGLQYNEKPAAPLTAHPPLNVTHSATSPASRAALRARLREQRRGLTPEQQRNAALRLDRIVGHSALFRRSRHIAFFLANDGELDPRLLMHRAWRMGKVCYLPVITPAKTAMP